ncbi:VOC family protein [Marinobacter sp. CA1]|uniref:VOC family protein n=1 Tax=Marinobacter sp. CA1 TaxID=2817656 RepID=UPI001D07452C|nr:VOC family protein [Marinobacter sp. CA1]UDL03435.1 VOC family protein [Marinobacter sp. CA1]
MQANNINSVISVIPVKNFEESLNWYKKLFGRDPDVVPMEGIAEWQVVESAWIQVSIDPENAGSTTVVLGVNDVEAQCKTCSEANVPVGDVVEYPGVIKMAEAVDPDGNKISFVQDISDSSSD